MQRYGLIVVWGVLGYHFWLFCPKEALFLEEETVSGISFDDGMGVVVAHDGCGLKNVKCQNAEWHFLGERLRCSSVEGLL